MVVDLVPNCTEMFEPLALIAACPNPSLQLVAPLVHERDLYLAWSLKRSKAVNGARAVVGVVGKGHLRGVCYALTHDAGEPVISPAWMASWCQLLCVRHTDELQSALLVFGGSCSCCCGLCPCALNDLPDSRLGGRQLPCTVGACAVATAAVAPLTASSCHAP